MSAALVRKSLEIVDEELTLQKGKKKKKEVQVPQNFKLVRKSNKNQDKVNILQSNRKLTVAEVRKSRISEEDILRENLKRLKAIRQSCTLKLDKSIVNKIIERAVTKRPVKVKQVKKKDKKTAFTEEDFAKFEQEYTGD